MHKYLLLTMLLTAVVGLGALIDTQSHTPAVHTSAEATLQVVYAPGRLEGAVPEVELRPWIGGRVETIPVAEGDFV